MMSESLKVIDNKLEVTTSKVVLKDRSQLLDEKTQLESRLLTFQGHAAAVQKEIEDIETKIAMLPE